MEIRKTDRRVEEDTGMKMPKKFSKKPTFQQAEGWLFMKIALALKSYDIITFTNFFLPRRTTTPSPLKKSAL